MSLRTRTKKKIKPSPEHNYPMDEDLNTALLAKLDELNAKIDELIQSDRKVHDQIEPEKDDVLEQMKAKAKKISKEEGCVQHVNKSPAGGYIVEDWYDCDKTVCSYQNGIQK